MLPWSSSRREHYYTTPNYICQHFFEKNSKNFFAPVTADPTSLQSVLSSAPSRDRNDGEPQKSWVRETAHSALRNPAHPLGENEERNVLSLCLYFNTCHTSLSSPFLKKIKKILYILILKPKITTIYAKCRTTYDILCHTKNVVVSHTRSVAKKSCFFLDFCKGMEYYINEVNHILRRNRI